MHLECVERTSGDIVEDAEAARRRTLNQSLETSMMSRWTHAAERVPIRTLKY
jgi:hypothetical protein